MLADEQGGDGDGRGHDGGQSDDAGEVVLGEGEGCQAVETVQGPAEQAAHPAAGEDDGGARGEEARQHQRDGREDARAAERFCARIGQ